MPYKFGKQSLDNLATCDPRIRVLAHWLIEYIDFSVREGWRDQAKQDEYFAHDLTRVKWPNSKHNATTTTGFPESRAVHLLPYPWPLGMSLDSEEGVRRLIHFAGVVRSASLFLRIPLTWGGDWDGDFILIDNNFDDLLHYELKGV